ncbi:MAG: Glu/Leu/Phe/Val dehydrogenase dimerization domain-containing protein [Solirubrobacteraceae bacterium]
MDGCGALLSGAEHEHVEIVSEPDAGLIAVIAVHSTALGPAMGGVRRASYRSLADAIEDALRLSAAMTVKSSLAGLPLGGGKSVILDASSEASAAMLDAFAAQLEQLGGRYIAAEDIGTSPADMDRIARGTRWVAGRSPQNGGGGDPSPSTARTVFAAIAHALELLDGEPRLHGVRAGVVGVGKVGAELALMLARHGAQLTVADLDNERAHGIAAATGGEVAGARELLERDLDVLAPCARGGAIHAGNLERVRARVLCGAANNLLADDALAQRLADAGTLYVPDFLANAGGIVHAGGEALGWSEERIEHTIRRSIDLGESILQEAAGSGRPPLEVARRLALARVREAAAARAGEGARIDREALVAAVGEAA